MSEPLYSIQKGKFTYYLECSHTGIEFKFIGFTIEGTEGFFKKYHYDHSKEEVSGHPCIDISAYLLEKLKIDADIELKEYLEKHISDYSTYEKSDSASKDLWENAGVEVCQDNRADLDCSKVMDGIVTLSINGYNAVYDFNEGKFTDIHSIYGDKDKTITPMEAVYGDVLDQMLAMEQYKRGLAPPVYTEMIRLREYLEGKKSLKLVMKNGDVHVLKAQSDTIYLFTLLKDTGCEFMLADNYLMKPRLVARKSLAELDYFQYGHSKFVIDIEAWHRRATSGPHLRIC